MADSSYQPKVYRKQGGDEMVIADGGKIVVESGGTLELQAGAIATLVDEVLAAADIALAEGKVLIGNAGGAAEAQTPAGDVTITAGGTTAIGAKKVLEGMVALADGKVIIGDIAGAGAAKTPSGDLGMTREGVFSLIDRFRKRAVAAINTVGAGSYSAAQMAGGVIQRDPNGAARADTLDTAANIVAALTNPVIGGFLAFFVHNIGSTGENITITSPGGPVTLDGSLDVIIRPGQVACLLVRATNVTAATEAVTVYRLDVADIIAEHIDLADGKVIIGDVAGAGAAKTPSGDLTMTREGVFSLIARYRVRAAASINTAGAGSPTAANLIGGMIKRNPNGGARTDTLPTAAEIVAAMANAGVGVFCECIYRNESAVHAEIITLAAGLGLTLDPATIIIQPGAAKRLLIVADNVTALAEAVTVFDISRPPVLSGVVTAEDAKTTSREENVAGLASAIALCTEARADMISHFANAARHTTGQQSSAGFGAVPTTLAGLLATTGTLLTAFAAHNADAILAAGWAYHTAQMADKVLVSAVTPVTLQEAVTRLNDLKAKHNDHEDDAGGHAAQPSVVADQVAAADAAYGTAILVDSANVLSGDLVTWAILNDGTGNVTGVSAVAGAGGITVTFSADPQNDAIISYAVFRALS